MKKKVSLFSILLYIFFALLAVITIFPFYDVLIVSFANTATVAANTPYLIPHVIDFTGYKTIMKDPYFLNSILVTLTVTVVGTSLNMLFSVVGAYVLSKKRLPGRNIFLFAILFTMFFGGGMIPTYLIVLSLGLVDTIWSMMLPCLISTYYLVIMKNYFASLPPSLEEAARIDGANEWVILTRIFIPISIPFMATFALFYSVERWNEWYNALLYIQNKSLWPLQIYLHNVMLDMNTQLSSQIQQIIHEKGNVFPQAVQMATIVVTMFPILCVYPFLQKYFVKGIMIGSIKE